MEQNNQTSQIQTPPTTILQNTPTEVAPVQTHCNRCHSEINSSFYFCPHCGHKIKEPPYHFTIIGTISILLISFLFPPFGLIPGIRYLKNKDKKAKLIGALAIIVTIIATVLFIIFIKQYLEMVNTTINSINSANYYQ